MRSARWLILVVILWLVAMVLFACGAAAGEPTPTAATPGSPEALLQQRCGTSCHSLQRVAAARKTPEEWEKTVRRMMSKGAQLDDAEFAAVVSYLAATYK